MQLNNNIIESSTEYSIIQNENKLFINKIDTLEYKIDDQDEKIEELLEKLDNLRDIEEEEENLREQISEYKDNEQKLKERIAELNQERIAELNQTNYEFMEAKKEINETKKEISDLKTKIALKNTRMQELVGELKGAKSAYFTLRKEMGSADENDLNNQITEKEILIDELKQEVKGYEEKFQNMVFKDELERIQFDLESKDNQITSKDQKIVEKEKEIESITQSFEEEKTNLNEKIVDLNSKIDQNADVVNQIRDRDEIIRELQNQEEEFHEALLDNVKLTGEIEDWEKKFLEVRKQKEVLYDRINELNKVNNGNIAIIGRLNGRINDLDNKLEGKDFTDIEEVKSLQSTIDNLNSKVQELTISLSETNGKYLATKDQLDKLSPQLVELQEKNDNIKAHMLQVELEARNERINLSKTLSGYENEISQMKNDLEQKELELNHLRKGEQFKNQISTLKSNLEEATTMNDSLADDLSKVNINVLLEKKESRRLNEEIINLKRRIKILRRDLIKRS
ncbi:MAG: hypothetical protein ACTSQ5_12105 [Promethearchaeota archaeon]